MNTIRDRGLPVHPHLEDWERQSLYCLLLAIQQQSDERLLEALSRLLSRQSGILSLSISTLPLTYSYDHALAYPRHPAWVLQCVSLSASVACRHCESGSFSVSATGKGGVFIVPSFSYEKGAPILAVTTSRQFSGSLGFVPYPSCCEERFKSLVSIDLDSNQAMHIRISGDGCRIEFVSFLSFILDSFRTMVKCRRSPYSRGFERVPFSGST